MDLAKWSEADGDGEGEGEGEGEGAGAGGEEEDDDLWNTFKTMDETARAQKEEEERKKKELQEEREKVRGGGGLWGGTRWRWWSSTMHGVHAAASCMEGQHARTGSAHTRGMALLQGLGSCKRCGGWGST